MDDGPMSYYCTEKWSDRRALLDNGDGWLLTGRSVHKADACRFATYIRDTERVATRVTDEQGAELLRYDLEETK